MPPILTPPKDAEFFEGEDFAYHKWTNPNGTQVISGKIHKELAGVWMAQPGYELKVEDEKVNCYLKEDK